MTEHRVPSGSPDLTEENIQKLKQLFPEILTDGEKIDFEKLKLIMGEEVEESKEHYQFTWHGKREAIRGAQIPSKGTLKVDKASSKNFDTTENLYIEGDNLEVLKLLQKSYNGKIKMIYIDPPYNTGKDFVYKDNFHDGVDHYLEMTGQKDEEGNRLTTNTDSSGRFHTDWLNMMYPRLKLAKNLLTEDGVIFISIDDNEVSNLKSLCDELFGELNFAGIITWDKKRKGSFLSKNIISLTEYCLVYSKNLTIANIVGGVADNNESQPLIKRTNSRKALTFPANVIKTKLKNGYYQKGIYGDGSSSVELLDGVSVVDGVITSELKIVGPFIWTQSTVDEQLKLNAQFIINTLNFQLRVFKVNKDNSFKGLPSLINGVSIKGTNEDAYEELKELFGIEKVFDYSKPRNLLCKLIKSQTFFENDGIVLDFFSGSAATAHATMQLNAEDDGNRKFIMVQLPEETEEKSEAYKAGYKNICEIGKERIRRAGEKIIEENPEVADALDIGFKVLKLDKSNIREWNADFDNIELTLDTFDDVFIPDAKEIDIVYEIMLKTGLELTLPIHSFRVDGKNVYDIAFGNLFICLDDQIDRNIAAAIIEKRKEYEIDTSTVVFKDAGFANNDSEKLNCFEMLKDAGYTDEQLMTI